MPIAIIDDKYEIIGTCRVFRNEENGKHFGELLLDKEISSELYFYYRSRANNAGIFIFAGLDFTQNELSHSPTTKLKEMIISQ